ncbi:MAG: elongation factor G [Thermodesulfobacteriota bacterium]
MAAEDPARIRNVILIGHGGVGKTSLAEAMLLAAGATKTLGRTADGTSSFDTEPEEQKRGSSIFSGFYHLEWKKTDVNVIDAPGAASFIHDASNCMRAATTAVLVMSPNGETKGEDEKVLSWAAELQVPRIAFVTRMDRERASFEQAVTDLAEVLEQKPVPVHIPIGAESSFKGVVDLLGNKAWLVHGEGGQMREAEIPSDVAEEARAAREKLVEAVAESNDALLERYLDSGELAQDEIVTGLREAILKGALLPVLCGAGANAVGASTLLDFVVQACPSAAELPAAVGDDPKSGSEVARAPSTGEPFAAQIVRTVIDPFAGKLSVFRVFSGQVAADSTVYNSTRQVKEKLGHLFRLEGRKQTQIARAVAGDVVAVAKLKDAATGDTLCDDKVHTYFPRLRDFEPSISFALEAKNKGEEDKVMAGLHRLQEEDPALHLDRDEQTKEIILGGIGQLHIEATIERLKRKFGVDVVLKAPKVPYKETIRGKAQAEGKVKKQTGGHGQFAVAWLEVEPLPRGAGFEFVDKIVGGVVPRNFIPAVEKGVREALPHGTIAGYPVVDVRVTLFDGKHHDVDSSEMAFKTAAALGFKSAVEQAKPVLLEPIMALDVQVPDDAMGDVIGDVNARRGKVQGVEPRGHSQVIKARVPMSEMLKYGPDLNAMTAGRGSFHMEFSHYEELPAHLVDKVVKEAKRQAESA